MRPIRRRSVAITSAIVAVIAMTPVEPRAAEIFKCADPDGKTVFQGTPCAGSGNKIAVKPANGTIAPDTPPEGTRASSATVTSSKLKASVSAMELDRKKREIDYDIRDLEAEVDR